MTANRFSESSLLNIKDRDQVTLDLALKVIS
jgi:hypothetical protein